jgi:hypothetical protein
MSNFKVAEQLKNNSIIDVQTDMRLSVTKPLYGKWVTKLLDL